MDSTGWLIIFLIILLALSAFFSASETAFSTMNKIRMRTLADSGDKRAQRVCKVVEDYDKMISTVLIGNNIVNIAASSLATVLCIQFLDEQIAATVSTAVMTILVLVFGEVSLKSYAKANADVLAIRFSYPMTILLKVLTPLSFLLVALTKVVGRVSKKSDPPTVTEEELKYIIESTVEEGVLHEDESDLLHSAIEFDDIKVQEILTPRVDIAAVDVADDVHEIMKFILEERFSRIPVYEGTVDKIIGILHTRDFLEKMALGDKPDIRSLLSECLYVHKNMKISKLLSEFKRTKINMAVVMDDYGGTMGLVTTEDILEELVGEIWDEDEEIVDEFVSLGSNRYEIAGEYTVRELLDELDMDEDTIDTDSNTIGGWAMEVFGRIPEVGDSFEQAPFKVTVKQVDDQRIEKLLIEVIEKAKNEK